MTDDRWQRAKALFQAAMERPAAERDAFLAAAAGDDEAVRREVESLLAADGRHVDFLDWVPAAAGAVIADLPDVVAPVFTPHRRIGSYEIVAPLGAGGMGEVYLAEDSRLGRKVALKVLPAAFTGDERRLRRFEQEARAASALNHPNILTVFEIGQSDDVQFIATEYIDGMTLRQRLTHGRMKLDEALDIAIQVTNALTAAHAAGIVHRDIKPDNVMVRHDGIVKLLDFGLVKLTEQQSPGADTQTQTLTGVLTDSGAVMGTVSYMSPEQARGLEMDARTDIFSLGVVLYEMVSGRAPFSGETRDDVLLSILEKEPPPLTRFVPAVPAELEWIVSRALRKDRDERLQTAKEMLGDLRRLKQRLDAEAEWERSMPDMSGAKAPAESAASTSAAHIARRPKRHRVALAAFGALLLAIAGVTAYWRARNSGVAIESIAVLPFENRNRAPESDYLADGVADSIINNLAQLSNLRVIARSSVFRYKGKEIDPLGAGRALGVRAVVTGQVLQRGENLTISAALMDVRENRQLWGQQYNRALADVFAVQEEIAKEISATLRLKLTGAERQQLARRPTENIKAFQYYLQGRSFYQRRTRDDMLTAVHYYEKAIAEDGNYALAYAGLADAYGNLASRGYIAPIEGRRKEEEAARKALALDDDLAEAHAALGFAHIMFPPHDFSQGDRELRRAIGLSPSLAMAHLYLGGSLARQGRLDESLEEYRNARQLDPLSPVFAHGVAFPYYLKRDYRRALELLRQADELGPAFSATWEIDVYIRNRLFDEARVELEKAKSERTNDPILIHSTGMLYAAQGNRAGALEIIRELEELSGASQSQAHWIAKIYAASNEKELALMWLERGFSAGALGSFYKDEPVWDALRGDPRFADLLRRMGLPA